MNIVYYLCETDKPEQDGLVFVKELDSNTYSLGNWYIEIRPNERNPKFLEFDAIIDNAQQKLILNRFNRNIYIIELKNLGIVYMRLVRAFERHKKYIGNSKLISCDSKLFQIVPMNVQELESLCRETGFYFIGKNDNDLLQ